MEGEAFRRFERMSPFEIKDELIRRARGGSAFLNAGRGNPNWIATHPREAFFLLGQFALSECRRARDEGILAGMPAKTGIGLRFESFLDSSTAEPGAAFLRAALDYGVRKKGFDK